MPDIEAVGQRPDPDPDWIAMDDAALLRWIYDADARLKNNRIDRAWHTIAEHVREENKRAAARLFGQGGGDQALSDATADLYERLHKADSLKPNGPKCLCLYVARTLFHRRCLEARKAKQELRRNLRVYGQNGSHRSKDNPTTIARTKDGPDAIAETRELVNIVRDALATLSEDERELISLRVEEELAFGEIAKRIGISKSCVILRFNKLLVKLQPKLRGLEP